MLVDEIPCEPTDNGVSPRHISANASYAQDTLIRQPHVTDLLPQRLWVHLLLWVCSLLIVTGLVMLHHWQLARPNGPWDIFKLHHPASLATWLSVMGLVGIAALSLNIFSLRRFRKSDYHSYYRCWVWVGVAALVSSLAVATNGHGVIGRVAATATGWSLPYGDQLFWLIPVAGIYTYLAIRLGLEFRHCRLALCGVVVAWLVFCLKNILLLGYSLGLSDTWQMVLMGGSTPLMVALLSCGFLWYARHVLLDVRGRLPAGDTKNKTEKVSSASPSAAIRPQAATARPKGRSDLEPDVSHRAAELVEESEYDRETSEAAIAQKRRTKDSRKRHAGARNHVVEEQEMPEHRTREQQRKLSKAERKKLRKLKARERHAA